MTYALDTRRKKTSNEEDKMHTKKKWIHQIIIIISQPKENRRMSMSS